MRNNKNRRQITTTLNVDLIRNIRSLAALNDKNLNDLIEEAMRDLIKKYDKGKNK